MFVVLGISKCNPTLYYGDNQSCIKLVENPIMHEKTKHIDKGHILFEKRFR
jgi:hypothetical protein